MDWKDQYKAVLVETDPSKLLNLIHDTEVAMSFRSESLSETAHELQEMDDATRALGVLKNHAQSNFAWAALEKNIL